MILELDWVRVFIKFITCIITTMAIILSIPLRIFTHKWKVVSLFNECILQKWVYFVRSSLLQTVKESGIITKTKKKHTNAIYFFRMGFAVLSNYYSSRIFQVSAISFSCDAMFMDSLQYFLFNYLAPLVLLFSSFLLRFSSLVSLVVIYVHVFRFLYYPHG